MPIIVAFDTRPYVGREHRRTACAVRCNGAPTRCDDATVLRVNSWENLDNGGFRCCRLRRDTFDRFEKVSHLEPHWLASRLAVPFKTPVYFPVHISPDDIGRSDIGKISTYKTVTVISGNRINSFYLRRAYHRLHNILEIANREKGNFNAQHWNFIRNRLDLLRKFF